MTPERRFSLMGVTALLLALPLVAAAQTTPTTPKVFFACYGSLTGVVYRIKETRLPTNCLHPTHVQFSWTSGAGGTPVTDHAALQGLGNDDHPQYLLVDGTRALTGALNLGTKKITNLGAATANGEAVRYEQAVKSGDAAGGDLAGTYPAPTVAKLQNTAVSSATPADGQVLTFNGSAWTPATASSGGGLPCDGCVKAASIADGAITRAKLAADVLTPVAFGHITVEGLTCSVTGSHSVNVTSCFIGPIGVSQVRIEGENINSTNYTTLVNSMFGSRVGSVGPGDSGHLSIELLGFGGAPQAGSYEFTFVTFKSP